jgi:DtxR family Mn-dependent transcriptional regulator
MNKKLSASTEDYIEAVYLLSQEAPAVRVKDISERLSVSRPSVHKAVHVMADKGYIEHEPYGYIYLTETGRKKGEALYNRHCLIESFLKDVLGVSDSKAAEDACRIEHSLSDESMRRLMEFMKNETDRS